MKNNKTQNEQYSITIFSRTDVKKKPLSFHISRRRLIIAASGVVLAALLAVGVAAASLLQVSGYSEQINSLSMQAAQKSDVSLSLAAAVSPGVQEAKDKHPTSSPSMEPTSAPTPQLMPEYAAQISRSLVELQEEDAMQADSSLAAADSSAAVVIPAGSIAVGDAMAQINTAFETQIQGKIEEAKADAQYDTFQTVYTGDMEGDSDTVNNWADVLAVYAVATGTELRGLNGIPQEDMELLSSIYNSMNKLEVTAKTTSQKAPATSAEGQDTPPATTLTACLNVDSLTYEDGAGQQNFSKDQKQALEELMSPDYYAVFAQLLGIDYYDGMNADELSAILSNLQEGTTGAAIVQAALTRVGNPYSKGSRGSGRYVDCSYFAWWAYDQAGVVIPKTSVEQARYCYNNGCKVNVDDLQPGDLIFWSKSGCNCGRWHEIHHTAIYLGDNKIIEASSSRGRVVINELWGLNGSGGWKVFMCARPYAQ